MEPPESRPVASPHRLDALNMVSYDTPPSWARFFTAEEYARFVLLIEGEMHRRDLAYDIADGVVEVFFPDRPVTSFGLLNLAQLCHQVEAETWPDVVAHHFEVVLAARADSDELAEQDYDAVRELLKLRLYPASYGADASVELVSFPLTPDIVVALVYDLPMAVTTVRPDRVESWGVPLAEVFAEALDNVEEQVPVQLERMSLGDGAAVFALTGESFFASTHTLLLDRHLVIPELGGIVAIPNRHLVLFHAIEDMRVTTAVNAMAQLAMRRFEEGPGSVSPYIYWWRNLSDNERELVFFPTHVDGNEVTVATPDVFQREVLERLLH